MSRCSESVFSLHVPVCQQCLFAFLEKDTAALFYCTYFLIYSSSSLECYIQHQTAGKFYLLLLARLHCPIPVGYHDLIAVWPGILLCDLMAVVLVDIFTPTLQPPSLVFTLAVDEHLIEGNSVYTCDCSSVKQLIRLNISTLDITGFVRR